MDEFFNDSTNPFDRFLESPDLTMLNAALPHVGDPIRKPLALYIKLTELHRILADMDNEEVLTACGFEDHNPNIENVLRAMKAAGGKDGNPQLDSILNALETFQMYQSFMELMQKNPELVNLINSIMGQKDHSSQNQNLSSDTPDMFGILSEFLKKQDLGS